MIFSQEMELLILIQHQKSKNCVEKGNRSLNFRLTYIQMVLFFKDKNYLYECSCYAEIIHTFKIEKNVINNYPVIIPLSLKRSTIFSEGNAKLKIRFIVIK